MVLRCRPVPLRALACRPLSLQPHDPAPVVVEPPGREIVCAGPETIPDFWRAYAIGGKKLPPLPPALD